MGKLTRRGFLGLIGPAIGGLVLWGRGFVRAHGQPLFIGSELETRLAGRVVDLLSGQPVLSAQVSAVESVSGVAVATTTTLDTGDYALAVPEGTYEVGVAVSGYVHMSKVRQRVDVGSTLRVDFDLVPLEVDSEGEKRIYEALVAGPQSPLDGPYSSQDGWPSTESPLAASVPDTIVVDFPDGRSEIMPLEEYLKGVVPSEVPSSWHQEALKAQAVAARSYAVAYASTHNGRICATTACQVYSNVRYATTSQAVDATRRQVAVYNGAIIWAYFFSRCNAVSTRNSNEALASSDGWKTCRSAPWGYVAYCRARSCGGHSPGTSDCGYTGHGVGMCQWGAKARADSGSDYRQIITDYYTSVTIEGATAAPAQLGPVNGALFKSGDAITLTWTVLGSGFEYRAELRNASTAATQAYGWTTAASWPVGGLAKGTYEWRVKARAGGVESQFSGYWKIVVSDTIYKTYLTRVDKISTVGP